MAVTALSFRKATPADAAAIVALVCSAYRGDESRTGWTTAANLVVGDRIDEAGALAKISEPHGAVLLAFESSSEEPAGQDAAEAVACCELLRREDGVTAEFGMFAVRPQRQGGGLGRKVLERAELYARDAWGVRELEMCVIWTREELIAWYVRRGYRLTGEKRPFPYAELVNGRVLRDDLSFVVLSKSI